MLYKTNDHKISLCETIADRVGAGSGGFHERTAGCERETQHFGESSCRTATDEM